MSWSLMRCFVLLIAIGIDPAKSASPDATSQVTSTVSVTPTKSLDTSPSTSYMTTISPSAQLSFSSNTSSMSSSSASNIFSSATSPQASSNFSTSPQTSTTLATSSSPDIVSSTSSSSDFTSTKVPDISKSETSMTTTIITPPVTTMVQSTISSSSSVHHNDITTPPVEPSSPSIQTSSSSELNPTPLLTTHSNLTPSLTALSTSTQSMSMTSQSQTTASVTTIQPTPSITPTQTPPTPSVAPTQSTKPPTTSPPPSVKISETNILLVKELDSIFIELSGTANIKLEGVFLIIRNAKEKDDATGLLQFVKLTGNLNAQGLLVLDKSQLSDLNIVGLSSVVIALYSDESQAQKVTDVSLLDSFVLSEDPGSVDSKVAEVYQPGAVGKVSVNASMLSITKSDISMSLCSGVGLESGFVLTTLTKDQPNQCQLNEFHAFQMKLTLRISKKKCPVSHLPNHFENLLTKEIVTKVNQKRQCGLASFNVDDMNNQARCIDDDKVIAVNFNIKSAFDGQIDCIRMGYESFTGETGSVSVDGSVYSVSNCSRQCFPNAVPAPQTHDDKIKVTVAVVVTCIGIFLVILLAVIIYMKRKKRGLLQFRMTRLDEDDDDLVGDMDDFVGNQGATFSNFK